jgi:hypothetical protein
MSAGVMSDAALEALWKNVVDHWNDDKAHAAFLEHCQSSDQLVEAAVRYRGMKGDRDRGPEAEKRLQGVALLAMAKLEAARSASRPSPRRTASLVLIGFFVFATLGLSLYLISH